MQDTEYTSIEFEARGNRLALLFSLYAHDEYEDVGGLIAIAQGIAEDHLEDNDDKLKDCWANSISQYLDSEEFPESVEEIDEELFLSEDVLTWDYSDEDTRVFIYPRGVLPIKQEEALESVEEGFSCSKSESVTTLCANVSRSKILDVMTKILSATDAVSSIDLTILPEWDQEEGQEMTLAKNDVPADLAGFLASIREAVLENGHTKMSFNFTDAFRLELCESRMLNLIIDEKNSEFQSAAQKIFGEFQISQNDEMRKISDGWFYGYSFDDELDSESLISQLKKLGFK